MAFVLIFTEPTHKIDPVFYYLHLLGRGLGLLRRWVLTLTVLGPDLAFVLVGRHLTLGMVGSRLKYRRLVFPVSYTIIYIKLIKSSPIRHNFIHTS